MTDFARSFPLSWLLEWDSQAGQNAVRALFARWALPGEQSTSRRPLRLGIRDGYVNFYTKGQSVAKLSCAARGPQLSIHRAYVTGQMRGAPPVLNGSEKDYRKYEADALSDLSTAALIDGWVETADSYASAEKRFVDDLIASNSHIIDLEMGLPANDDPSLPRVAPRMDIVAVQSAAESPCIVFWEAKCANNTELRAQAEFELQEDGSASGPKVISQVAKYVGWMGQAGRAEQVAQAYKDTAALLLRFYQLRGDRAGEEEPECVAIWRALTAAKKPGVLVQPGVVIGNYWPEGSTEPVACERMKQAAASFLRNGHRDKLERNGISIFEVTSEGATLPNLPLAPVTA